MKLTNPALNALMEKLEAQPNLTSTTPGPKCRECGSAFTIVYGRHSKYWRVFHNGGNGHHQCPAYRTNHPKFNSQEDAIRYAETL